MCILEHYALRRRAAIVVLWILLHFARGICYALSLTVIFLFQEALQAKGLRDDTTCIVIDILPQEKPPAPLPPPKKQGKGVFKSMFRKKSNESSSYIDKEYIEPDMVEELCEEGSAMLSERFVLKKRKKKKRKIIYQLMLMPWKKVNGLSSFFSFPFPFSLFFFLCVSLLGCKLWTGSASLVFWCNICLRWMQVGHEISTLQHV